MYIYINLAVKNSLLLKNVKDVIGKEMRNQNILIKNSVFSYLFQKVIFSKMSLGKMKKKKSSMALISRKLTPLK